MTLLTSLTIASVALVLRISAFTIDPVSLIVNTTHGPVRGEAITLNTNKSLVQFLGVPFAQAERFGAPKAPNPWKVVLNGTSFGKACPQTPNLVVNSTEDIDEDCLSVNVFVPRTEATVSKLAVMVWIYGGGFLIGGSSYYNGAFIATEGEVVVVTFNYRLGVLGFLSTGTRDIPGNFGLLDQVKALHWVQKNIERFGGNPKQVTLFGQSAGAISIALHMFSPLTNGLYHQVILESGTALAVLSVANNASALEVTKTVANMLSCEIPGLKECLKKRNVSEILTAQSKLPPFSFWPVVDHVFLKDQPSTLLNKGDFNQTVPAMIGVTKNEGGFFVLPFKGMHPGVPGIDKGLNKTLFDQLIKKEKWINHQTSQAENAIIFEYTDWANQTNPSVVRQKYMDVITDCIYKAPAVRSAKAFVEHDMKTYFYRFDHFVSRTYPPWAGVVHCADLVYVFGYPFSHYNKSTAPQDKEITFSKDIISMWGNFAKTGDPTPDGKPFKWPEFSRQKQEYASLSPSFAIQSHLLPEKMAFWNSYIQSLTRSNPNSTQAPIAPTTVPTQPSGQTKANGDKGTEHALIGVVVALGVLLLVLLVVVWRLKGKLVNALSDPGPSTRLL